MQQHWTADKIKSCGEGGGEESNLGVMDIEDLFEFAMNSHQIRKIAIYRIKENGPFGLHWKLERKVDTRYPPFLHGGAAEICGELQIGDWLLSCNDTNIRIWQFC